MKRPAFQFYPADWMKALDVRACSIGARGLWIDMIALMHQADPYGHLVVNGNAIDNRTLARMVGESPRDIDKLINELEAAGVFSRTEDGAIYCRRMVRDEDVRSRRAAGGKLGGNPNLLGGAKDDSKVAGKVNHRANVEPTPSSSSSSSSSNQPSRTPSSKGARRASAPLPDPPEWLDTEVWALWVAHRRELRKPLTPTQCEALFAKLDAYRAEGHDPVAVIRHSIACGYQGLFPPDKRAASVHPLRRDEPDGPRRPVVGGGS